VNPFAFAALLVPAVLGAPARGTLDLGDRTEARGGYLGLPPVTDPDTGEQKSQDPVLNLETAPTATLKVETHRSNMMLQYAPRFGLSDVQLGLRPYVLNAGAAQLGWRARSFRLTLDEVASYGQLNTTSALPTSTAAGTASATGPVNNARPYAQLTYQASSTTLTALLSPERRWSLRLALSYAFSGGARGESRDLLTYQYGPRAELTFDAAVTRHDRLQTQASVEGSTVLSTIQRTSAGLQRPALDATYNYVFIRGTEGWSHNFSREVEGSISAGVTQVHSELRFSDPVGPPQPPDRFWDTYPTAELSLIEHLPVRDKFDLQLRAVLTPAANRLTGLLSQQFQTLLNGNWQRQNWTYLVEGVFAQSLKDDEVLIQGTDQPLSNKVTYLSVRTGAAYAFTRYCSLEGGVILAYQQAGNFAGLFQRMGYLALTVRNPTLEF
jgi:hypothetical protein